jgi:hypothetical protein
MSLETRANVINFPDYRPPAVDGSLALAEPVRSQIPDNVVLFEARPKPPRLQERIDYLDSNYQQEDLSHDWWNINDVGFSMNSQMRLLAETGDKSSWVNQVERDLRGFALEYLKQGTVFPFEYEIVSGELIDRRYGNRRMIDTVDQKERGGAVRESLSLMQEYLLTSESGATAIMVSPPGFTGLTMDNGRRIVYEDTMIFHLQRKGDRVIGTTLRTDFDLEKARKLIKQLTGKDLPEDATVIDCVKAVSFLGPEDISSAKTVYGLIDTLVNIKQSPNAYKDKKWSDMRRDVDRREELYAFDAKATEINNDFTEYVLSGGQEIQKALGASFLEFSNHFMIDKKSQYGHAETGMNRTDIKPRTRTYGQIIEDVQKLPGCAGGGNSTSVTSLIERPALVEKKKKDMASLIKSGADYEFDHTGECLDCHKDPTLLGPCDICVSCDAKMGGKAAKKVV